MKLSSVAIALSAAIAALTGATATETVVSSICCQDVYGSTCDSLSDAIMIT